MKILYGIQGTGNGHLTRAAEILPHLQNHGKVDVLVSGRSHEINISSLKYQKKGLGFRFGNNGGINYLQSLLQFNPLRFLHEAASLPVEQYDLVLHDFDPVTAWACKIKKVPCIGISHQASFLSIKTPRPSGKNYLFEYLLRNYAPANKYIGFHFAAYDLFIHTPIIRKAIREAENKIGDHFTVYLPSYHDELLIHQLIQLNDVKWEIFSKNATSIKQVENVLILPVTAERFTNSITASAGVVCGAGFEPPAEALFLGKKLLVIPMKGQYEQACNCVALQLMGVKSLDCVDNDFLQHLARWIQTSDAVKVHYQDSTANLINGIFGISKSMQINSRVDPLSSIQELIADIQVEVQ